MAHGLEVALHSVYANGQAVFQRKVLRMLREHGAIVTLKRKIVTHEHPQPDCSRKAKSFVVSIPDSDRKPASIEARLEIEHSEHFHAVF